MSLTGLPKTGLGTFGGVSITAGGFGFHFGGVVALVIIALATVTIGVILVRLGMHRNGSAIVAGNRTFTGVTRGTEPPAPGDLR